MAGRVGRGPVAWGNGGERINNRGELFHQIRGTRLFLKHSPAAQLDSDQAYALERALDRISAIADDLPDQPYQFDKHVALISALKLSSPELLPDAFNNFNTHFPLLNIPNPKRRVIWLPTVSVQDYFEPQLWEHYVILVLGRGYKIYNQEDEGDAPMFSPTVAGMKLNQSSRGLWHSHAITLPARPECDSSP